MNDSGDLITTVRGDPENTTLVLLVPGMSGNYRQWDSVIDQLSDVAADIAFSVPIRSHPALGDDNPSVRDVIDALTQILRNSRYRHVVIASHSVGSFVALGIAQALPDVADRLILVNGGLTSVARFLDRPFHELVTRPTACLTFVRLFVLISLPTPAALRRAVAKHRWFSRLLLGSFVSDSAIDARDARSALVEGGGRPDVIPGIWKNRHHWQEFVSYAHAIKASVLFVVGSRDPMSTEQDTRAMAALLPNARVRLLDGIGHAAPLEAADVISGIIRGALEDPGTVNPAMSEGTLPS
jgi:pimeloyl-ACP methyl ester carboxylesterase